MILCFAFNSSNSALVLKLCLSSFGLSKRKISWLISKPVSIIATTFPFPLWVVACNFVILDVSRTASDDLLSGFTSSYAEGTFCAIAVEAFVTTLFSLLLVVSGLEGYSSSRSAPQLDVSRFLDNSSNNSSSVLSFFTDVSPISFAVLLAEAAVTDVFSTILVVTDGDGC